MTKKLDLIVFIARGQPWHNAHLKTVRNALEISENVLVIFGSANQPRTVKNPFTVDERSEMLIESLTFAESRRVNIDAVEDNMYNDTLWGASIQDAVSSWISVNNFDESSVGITGHLKDDSSFYLKMFPQWKFIEQPLSEPLSATDIRELYFSRNYNKNFLQGVLPPSTIAFLEKFSYSTHYENLLKEKEFIDGYKKQYAAYPYPPIFVTTDAVVVQSGHILMIQRRSEPGRGLWALPGGFVNANTDKSLEDAMVRELYEETGIKVPEKVTRGSIIGSKVFDAINRSARGRTITHAFLIVYNNGEWKLPKISAADDAMDAKWVPFSELKRSEIFDDHFDIIKTMIASM